MYICLKVEQKILFGQSGISLKQLFSQFFDVNIWPVHWYIISTMIFYIIFYLVYNNLKIEKADFFMCLCVFLYLLYCFLNQKNETYYVSTIGIVEGILYAKYENKITILIQKYGTFILGIVFLIWINVYYYPFFYLVKGYRNFILEIGPIYRILSSTLFCICIAILLNKIYFGGSKILKFLGYISLEIYLVHSFVQNLTNYLFLNSNIISSPSILYGIKSLCEIILVIIFSFLLKKIIEYINNILIKK